MKQTFNLRFISHAGDAWISRVDLVKWLSDEQDLATSAAEKHLFRNIARTLLELKKAEAA